MDNIYEYKCEHCGGVVSFDNKRNIWICQYCKSTYSNLYKNEGKTLSDSNDFFKVYYYYCNECGNSFYSRDAHELCFKCNGKLSKTEDELSGVIVNHVDFDFAKHKMRSALSRYSREYNIDLNNIELKDKYIKCDALSGSISISNGRYRIE